uniref:Uncharacterized protein n=1 Tax=Cacopsylla melanoneura TaxID=428564 RepID=A0A8D9A467_9HEMI
MDSDVTTLSQQSDSGGNTQEDDSVPCPHCNKRYKKRGLTRHIRCAHPNDATSSQILSQVQNDSQASQNILDQIRMRTPLDPPGQPNRFTDEISTLKRNVPILKRIPKGARNVTAEKLSTRILRCINSNSVDAWKKLLLFSYECLRVPEKQGSRSLTNLVKDNVSSQMLPDVKKKRKKELTLEQRVEKKIEDFDTKGALRIITSNDTVAPVNDENYEKLIAMHPSPSRDIELPLPPNDTSIYLQATEKMVLNAILSFPNGSSAGIDGI